MRSPHTITRKQPMTRSLLVTSPSGRCCLPGRAAGNYASVNSIRRGREVAQPLNCLVGEMMQAREEALRRHRSRVSMLIAGMQISPTRSGLAS